MSEPKPTVFIGSSSEGINIAKAIQVELDHGCEVVIWSQGLFGLSGGTLEALVEASNKFDFAILVITPDDVAFSRGKEKQIPRDNVLLELGLFIGALGRERVFFIYERTKNIDLPSDLAGITPATFSLHKSGNLQSSVGASCTKIENAIRKLGARRDTKLRSKLVENKFESNPDLCHGLSGIWECTVNFKVWAGRTLAKNEYASFHGTAALQLRLDGLSGYGYIFGTTRVELKDCFAEFRIKDVIKNAFTDKSGKVVILSKMETRDRVLIKGMPPEGQAGFDEKLHEAEDMETVMKVSKRNSNVLIGSYTHKTGDKIVCKASEKWRKECSDT